MSRDGGRTYPGRTERALGELPEQPAAVMLYDAAGAARCLALDFDVSRGGRGQVDADAVAFVALVEACGGRAVADVSPAGGRHVYVFLSVAVPVDQVRPVMHALTARFPSLDATPMLNPAGGCIRPPGARHRSGGHQVLTTPRAAAQAVVAAPCGPQVWAALLDALASELAALHASAPVPSAEKTTLGGRQLSARVERIARTGVYDTTRYATPSEARQAVVTAAAAAGWTLPDLAGRLEQHAWAGLAGLYARYRTGARAALGRDWRKAQAWLGREKTPRKSTTRVTPHSAAPKPDPRPPQIPGDPGGGVGLGPDDGDVYGWLRSWDNGMRATEKVRYRDRAGLSKRVVLRALGAMAQRRGTRYVDVGRRSLALACHLDDSTVSEVLRVLRAEDDPLIVLVENERGVHGDLYELRIPDGVREIARWRRWRSGRIEAIHPAFRALGAPAALVYEALTGLPVQRRDLARDAALPPRTVDEALTTLAAHGLAERNPHTGWRRGPGCLDTLAEDLGATEAVDALQAEYAVERAAWRVISGVTRPLYARDVIAYAGPDSPITWPDTPDEPPPETSDDDHAYDQALADIDEHERHQAGLALLRAELGAVQLSDSTDWTDPRFGVYPCFGRGGRARGV